MIDKKAQLISLMDGLMFTLALIFIGGVVVFLFNPFNILGLDVIGSIKSALGL